MKNATAAGSSQSNISRHHHKPCQLNFGEILTEKLFQIKKADVHDVDNNDYNNTADKK